MKAQTTLEFFFAVTVFLIIFTWLSNFHTAFQTDSTRLILQQKTIANQYAALASRACASSINITHALPCLFNGTQNTAYSIIASGANANITINATQNATSQAACAVTAAVTAACGTTTCIAKNGNAATITQGAC
ncbi:TPA: hypothetical protein HA318_02195 [Candidatus Micrarchaeota archaeon]|nr:MAG: hypothetical protein AUJ65_05720 [Candidatus Micrarchaeota archaeon CG1_02_51_15]HII38789.1 hypothetical protein [Candidatus Micrarchaeota archaeon]